MQIKNTSKLKIKRSEGILVFVYVFVLAVHSWFQFGIYFQSPDDMELSTYAIKHGGIWQGAFEQAKSQSRFYQIIFVYITELLNALNYLPIYYLLRIGTFLLLTLGLTFFVRTLTQNTSAGLLCSIFFLLTYNFTGSYNAATAFPVWFSLGTTSFLWSLYFLLKSFYLTDVNRKYLTVSLGLLFISLLTYESMFLNIPIYLYILIRKKIADKSISEMKAVLRDCKIPLYSIAIFLFLYLSTYLAFQLRFPSDYPGNKISIGDLEGVFRTLITLSLGGYQSGYGLISNPGTLLQITGYLHAFFIVLFITIYVGSLNNTASQKKKTDLGISDFAVVVYAILAPNILFSLTERYRDYSISNPMYLGGLQSSLFSALVFTLFVYRIWGKIPRPFVYILFYLFAQLSYSNLDLNHSWSTTAKQRILAWKAIDAGIQSSLFESPNRVIFSPNLSEFTNASVYNYWDVYFSKNMNANYQVQSKIGEFSGQDPVFYIRCMQTRCTAIIFQVDSNQQYVKYVFSESENIFTEAKAQRFSRQEVLSELSSN